MAKFIIETYEDKKKNHYYITFQTDKFDGAEKIAEELNIPVEEYFRICKENDAYVVPSMSNDQEMFESAEQARTCLQKLLEFSIEFNRNKECSCNCDCEDDYSDITPVFPDDFESDGEEVSNEEINEIIAMCITELEEDEDLADMRVEQGNVIVLVNKVLLCDNPNCECFGTYYYSVKVCKDVYEYDDCPELED